MPNLLNPPRIRGPRVIAYVHTHPYTAYFQNMFNDTEGRGEKVNLYSGAFDSPLSDTVASGSSRGDKDFATIYNVPLIAIYEAVEFGKGSESYTWYGML